MCKNILITGATSFIGRKLIDVLIQNNYMIYAIIRPAAEKHFLLPRVDNLKLVELEMENYGQIAALVKVKCDVFYALSWNGTRGQEREDYNKQKKNYEYSMLSVREASKLGCGIIISAGSQAEYGSIQGKITEDTICQPNTAYGIYKHKFYETTLEYCNRRNIDFKEPRFFSLYGEEDSDVTMIISVIKKMIKNEDCDLTECIQLWDFLYISDAIEGLIDLMEKKCQNGVYNFGSGITKPLKDYIKEMYQYTNSKSVLKFGAIPYPKTGMVSIYPDVSKLKNETGWFPKVSFGEGIVKVIHEILNRKE